MPVLSLDGACFGPHRGGCTFSSSQFGSGVETDDAAPAPRGCGKVCDSRTEAFWGEQGRLQAGLKMGWENGGRRLAGNCARGLGLGWSFPPAGWGLHVWTFAWHLRGSPQAFLPAYLDVCRAEAEEGLGGLKALQPNITNGLNSVLELTHAFRWNWTFLGRCTVPRVRCSQTSH